MRSAVEIFERAQNICVDFLLQKSNESDPIKQATLRQEFADEFKQLNADIYAHLDDIQATCNLWHDKASAIQYENNLMLTLISKVDIDLAYSFDPNFPMEIWKEMYKNVQKIMEQNGLTPPKLCMSNFARNEIQHSCFTELVVQQYRYPHWVDVQKGDVFIDCGAFIGDSALWALQKGACVYSFEPEPECFHEAKANLRLNGYTDERCFNFAVGSQNKKSVFTVYPQNKAGSCMPNIQRSFINGACLKEHEATAQEIQIQCIRLDDFCAEHKLAPSFIKMDIEGFELEALKGAEKIIKQYKPKLAICLYHKDVDLWEIPLYIKSVVPEYKLFCRENGPFSEFILYATTGEKF